MNSVPIISNNAVSVKEKPGNAHNFISYKYFIFFEFHRFLLQNNFSQNKIKHNIGD